MKKMGIPLNTTLRLMAWPGMDISHQHVCKYANEAARDYAFETYLTYMEFTNKFVFISENKVRVPRVITNIHGYNYLRYKNPAWDGTDDASGLHWIYAFIVDMKYINDTTTEITFEIDYWTTYYPFVDFTRMAFVERCHPASDSYMDNVEGEPIEPGLMTYMAPPAAQLIDPLSSGQPNLVVLTTFESFNVEPAGGGSYLHATPRFFAGGWGASMLRPVKFPVWSANGQQDARNFFAKFSDREYESLAEGVVACYLAPNTVDGFVPLNHNHQIVITRPTRFNTTIGSYNPRWQKTIQYPFVYAEASANSNRQEYQFELSSYNSNHDIAFDHTGNDFGNVTIVGVPTYYKGEEYKIDESISLTGFPQVAWASSAFAQWLNENGNKQAISGITSAVATIGGISALAGGIATANPLMAYGGAASAIGGLSGIATQAENYRIASQQAPKVHGTPDANAMYTAGVYHILYHTVGVMPQHAEKIDQFFDRFGYAQNATLTLNNLFYNNSGNTGYNGSYIKTKNYSAKAGELFIPAKALNYISACFNRGITIWPSINLGN